MRSPGTRLVAALGSAIILSTGCAPSTETEPKAPAVQDLDGVYEKGKMLQLDSGRWVIGDSGEEEGSGRFRVEGNRFVVSGGSGCSAQGTYTWTLDGDALQLEDQQDPCTQRQLLFTGTPTPWLRVPPLEEATPGEGAYLPGLRLVTFQGEADVTGRRSTTLEIGLGEDVAGAGRMYFSPTVLLGSPGQRLRLTLENGTWGRVPVAGYPGDRPRVPHTFTVDEQGIDMTIRSGRTFTVTFPETGQLSFYCRLHLRNGHRGLLRVE